MSEPIKIAIVIEGGSVQAVLSAGVAVEFVIIDYDTEGGDAVDQIAIPQDGGEQRHVPDCPATDGFGCRCDDLAKATGAATVEG